MKTARLGSVDALLTNWRWEGETQWADSTVLLYNFDIDESELKPKHLDFLQEQVIPDLRDNPGARVAVVGTASMSGESGHNETLSENRAKAVMKHLIAKGVEAFKFKPSEPIGVGDTFIITAGCGWVQREGGPIEEIHPGDVVWFPAGEKHWHGATPTTAMTHIAIQEQLDGKLVEWMEQVSDDQYRR